MKTASRLLLAVGFAIARTYVPSLISHLALGTDPQLRYTRRAARWPAKLALLGAGAVVGGVTALMFAPAIGEVTRARLSKHARQLGRVVAEEALRATDGSDDGTHPPTPLRAHVGPASEAPA